MCARGNGLLRLLCLVSGLRVHPWPATVAVVRRRCGAVLWRCRASLHGSERRPPRRFLILARSLVFGTVAVCLSSCRVDMIVRVESDEFGAGRIAVTADLDRNAAAAVFPQTSTAEPNSATSTEGSTSRVRVDDFRKAGWEGPGLVRKADGSARFALVHRFSSVTQANALLGQLSGPNGPLADLQITRNRSPWATTISLKGPGDFRSGLSAFGDEQLASVTGSGAFGVSEAEVVRQAGGKSLDSVFSLRVDARLLAAERAWSLPSGVATPVSLSASRTSWATIAGTAAAVLALVAFVALQLRSNRSGGGDPDAGDDPAASVATMPAPGNVDAVGRL